MICIDDFDSHKFAADANLFYSYKNLLTLSVDLKNVVQEVYKQSFFNIDKSKFVLFHPPQTLNPNKTGGATRLRVAEPPSYWFALQLI